MNKELTYFQQKIVRGCLKQDPVLAIDNIALLVKAKAQTVRDFIKKVKEGKGVTHEKRRQKRREDNFDKTVNVIKPLTKPTTGINMNKSGIMDLETGDFSIDKKTARMCFSPTVLMSSYFDKQTGKHTFNTVRETLKFILKKTSVTKIFAHNFRGFENMYFINELHKLFDTLTLRTQGKNPNPFLIIAKKGNRTITFQDSYALIPYSLENITSEKGFDTATKKGELKKGNNAPFYPLDEIKEYNQSDCVGLFEALEQLDKEIHERFDLHLKNTVSSTGFTIIRKHYLPENIYIDKSANKAIRMGYHGGAVQILSFPNSTKNVLIVEADINSSYPFAMLNPLPFPPYTTIKKPKLSDIFEKEGFSYGTVTFPKDVMFPILTSKALKEKKMIFPGGSFKGLFPHPSLRFAIKRQGATFVPEYSIIGTPKTYLKPYAEDIYALRAEAKKEGNQAKSYTYKILLNSCYGRWGMSDEQTLWIVNNATEEDFDNPDIDFQLDTYIPLKIKNPATQAVVSVAAYITDYGRVNLWNYLYVLLETLPPENIVYTDTDAIFYIPLLQPSVKEWKEINTHEKDKKWLKAWEYKNRKNLRAGLVCNDELGSMKLELVGKRSDFITSKVYSVTKLDGEVLYRAKGFNVPETPSPETYKEWWDKLIAGKPIEMRGLLTFVTSLKKSGEDTDLVKVKEEVTRQLRNAYDKRVIVPLNNHPYLDAVTLPIEMDGFERVSPDTDTDTDNSKTGELGEDNAGGVRDGEIKIDPVLIERMSEDSGYTYEEVYECIYEHEKTHMLKSDGYVIKTFMLYSYRKMDRDKLDKFFAFYINDEKRVMKEAKKFPCSVYFDRSNIRGILAFKEQMIARLKMGLPVGLRVRGCKCEEGLSLREIEKRRKK